MWIKDINVKSFGALKDKSFSFNNGLNEIKENNEFGKSTLKNLIKAGFYGFELPTRYPYKPLDNESIDFSMQLYIDAKAVTLNREITSSAKGCLCQGDEKINIKNKPFFSELEKGGLENIKEIPASTFIIDSNSIAEMKNFTKELSSIDINSYQAFEYNGLSIDTAIKKLSEKARILYTNTKNSVSLYKKNIDRYEHFTNVKREILDFEEEVKEKYRTLRFKRKELEKVSLELEQKVKLKDINQILQSRKMLEDDLQDTKKELGKYEFDDELQNEKLVEYHDLLKSIDTANGKLEDLSRKTSGSVMDDLTTNEKNVIDEIMKEETVLSELMTYKKILEKSEDLSSRERYVKEKCNFSNLKKIDKARVSKSLDKYVNLKRDFDNAKEKYETNKGYKFNLLSLSVIIFQVLLIVLAVKYYNTSLALDIVLGVLMLVSIFYIFKTVRSEKINHRKDFYFKKKKLDEFAEMSHQEIFAINKARSVILNRLPFSDEDFSDVLKICDEVNEIIEEKNFLEEKTAGLSIRENKAINYIFDMSDDSVRELIQNVEVKEYFYSREVVAEIKMESDKKLIKQEIKVLNERLSELKTEFQKVFNSTDAVEINRIIKKKSSLNIILENLEKSICDFENKYTAINFATDKFDETVDDEISRLTNLREQLIEDIARLEEGLKTPMECELEDVTAELEQIKSENERIICEYNKIKLMITILEETREKIKNEIQPSYIKRANELLAVLTDKNGIEIMSSSSGNISFYSGKHQKEIMFNQLSSGSKAQCMLALKIAYLDEIDGVREYPLIVDDAFMTYDRNRLANAYELLKSISEERQIIYFSTR